MLVMSTSIVTGEPVVTSSGVIVRSLTVKLAGVGSGVSTGAGIGVEDGLVQLATITTATRRLRNRYNLEYLSMATSNGKEGHHCGLSIVTYFCSVKQRSRLHFR